MNAVFLGKVIELDETTKRGRIQLLKTGEFLHPNAPGKKLKIDQALLDEFHTNFHNGIRGKELPTNENHKDQEFRRCPAWIVDVIKSPGELHGVVEFTDDDLFRDVRDKKVKYGSPELMFDWQNPADGRKYNVMKAMAWTNLPHIKGMKPAEILNLSEIALEDQEFAQMSFDTALAGVMDDWKSLYRGEGWGGDWMRDNLKAAYKQLMKADAKDKPAAAIWFDQQITAFKNSICQIQDGGKDGRNPDMQALFGRYEGALRQPGLAALEPGYRDGPTPAKSKSRAPTKLAETETGSAVGDRAFRNGAQVPNKAGARDVEDDPGDTDDTDARSGSEDPDARDPDLPAQCASCVRLQESTCPFKGVDVKIAAAQDGNCPQYVPEDAEMAMNRSGQTSMGKGAAGAQTSKTTQFSERSGKNHPKENRMPNEGDEVVTLAAFESLEEQVTKLSELLSTEMQKREKLETENEDLRGKVQLTETQMQEETARRAQAEDSAFVSGFVSKGKATPHQAKLAENLLAIARGETVTIKLGEAQEETEATVRLLLGEIFEENDNVVPVEADEKNGNVTKVKANPKDADLTEAEQRLPLWEAKAKELAKASGKPWRAHLSEVARLPIEELKEVQV